MLLLPIDVRVVVAKYVIAFTELLLATSERSKVVFTDVKMLEEDSLDPYPTVFSAPRPWHEKKLAAGSLLKLDIHLTE
jgi:hypothetical protein